MFFDLDGTLWDATQSTALAWTEVFDGRGFASKVTQEQIRSVAGKPYLECLQIISPDAATSVDLPDLLIELEQAERAKMTSLGGDIYPGVLQGLKELSLVHPLFLVSNCNDWYLEAFLDLSGTKSLFKEAICFGGTGKPKHENLLQLISTYADAPKFYVGDTNGDRVASQMAGMTYLHAAYGFGGVSIQPEWHFSSFSEIVKYLKIQ